MALAANSKSDHRRQALDLDRVNALQLCAFVMQQTGQRRA
jgi:hypothetical protein